jgi:adenine-specific DNA-methyltransferase
MARRNKTPESIEAKDYRHTGEKRKNVPPAKIAAEGNIPKIKKARYYYSPHLSPELRFDSEGKADRVMAVKEKVEQYLTKEEQDLLNQALSNQQPWLEWAGKKEHYDRGWFEVDPVALHIHERVSSQAIVRAAMREDLQRDLFADPQLPYQKEIQFYQHDVDWANRLILGDSLQVMSSLTRRENMAGKVQMIYIDPPYGVRFGSNFQPNIGQRDVSEKQEDLTREPETVKAYRDTWKLGTHSYLSYLRERFSLARELLSPLGSIFVQIGDEHLHVVRNLLDEVFGPHNAIVVITIKKKSSTSPTESVADYLLWYTKNRGKARIRRLCVDKGEPEDADKFRRIQLPTGELRLATLLSPEERSKYRNMYVRDDYPVVSQDPSETRSGSIIVQGQSVSPGPNKHWRHDPKIGMPRLERAGRLRAGNTTAFGIQFWSDTGSAALGNVWDDTHGEANPIYVVQTNRRIVERCMHITTNPGDLVLDPTCGSGTTAFVAESLGRRWIAIDTSRVSVALTRQRLLTAQLEYYKLRDANLGICGGFVYKTSPLIEIGTIARNANLDPIFEKYDPILLQALEKCNCALSKVSDELRAQLKAKLLRKQKSEGKRSITDADRRRWELPKSNEKWEEWEVPFDTDPHWPQILQEAVNTYREVWRAKIDEINACNASNADQEELVDRPEVAKGVVRVCGPFTVEGVRPEELSMGDEGLFDGTPDEWEGDRNQDVADEVQNVRAYLSRMIELIRQDGITFPNNKHQNFGRVEPLYEESTGSLIHAEAIWRETDEHEPNNIGVSFGPQYGPVTAEQVGDIIRSGRRYDELVIAGFSFDAAALDAVQENQHPKQQIHIAHIRPDVSPGMDGLLKDTPNSQLFTVFGQPEIKIKRSKNGEYTVELLGVDIYDPLKGEVRSSKADKVAAWFLDGDYDGRCFCITQAFFPDQDAWDKIAKSLGSQADPEAFEAFNGTISIPFKAGKYRRVAVKVIDPRGNEVMTIARLNEEGM